MDVLEAKLETDLEYVTGHQVAEDYPDPRRRSGRYPSCYRISPTPRSAT